MKNILKAILILILPFALSSCSKKDDEPSKPREAIVRVEVTNNQVSNFEETINIQVVGDYMSKTEITGVVWDEVEAPYPNTKWFMKQGDTKPTNVYQTTDKVVSLTYATIINSKFSTTTPLVTTLKFFVDNKLVKTETVTTLDKISQISIPIVVSEM